MTIPISDTHRPTGGNLSERTESPRAEAAFGLRAYRGSREALLRAALGWLELTSTLKVLRRSFVWRGAEPLEYLCAAIKAAGTSIDSMAEVARVLQVLFSDPHGAEPPPLVVDLLWAHDPRGESSVVTGQSLPNSGPGQSRKLPLPTGRIVVHPDVPARASACVPLADVVPDAQDPQTGQWLSDHLYRVPEPYVERPQPFTPAFKTEEHPVEAGLMKASFASERADLLAAAAEALGMARSAGQAIDLGTARVVKKVPLSVEIPAGAPDGVRALLWLREVGAALNQGSHQLQRAVVLADEPGMVRGILLCQGDNPRPALSLPVEVAITVEAHQRWRADALYPRL